MAPQFLLVFPLWLFSLQAVAGCLQCDRRFLDSVATLLLEMLPADLPDRPALIQRHIQAFADLHGTFLRKMHERVLGYQTPSPIRTLPPPPKLPTQPPGLEPMHQRGPPDPCLVPPSAAVTEGPVLDCWTCLRIATQCFDGELCGVEDRRLAEYNEVVLYLFFVCESVLVTSIVLV
uniref:Uncharacterized protein n=1 Tax=Podarcis muralis TaxID=64176 RepID=A0A670JAB4_PODMU